MSDHVTRCFIVAASVGALMLFLIVACAPNAAPTLVNQYGKPVPAVPTLDADQVAQGKQIYQANCARCHGENGVGAPNWKVPDENLNYPPPPHDDEGHTWHHSDRVIYEAIRDGLRDPLKPNSELRMPAFGNKPALSGAEEAGPELAEGLSDAEIRAVIVYFKSLWNREHQEFQWLRTTEDVLPTPTPLP